MSPDCTLCRSEDTRPFARLGTVAYFRCSRCELTFMAPGQRPAPEVERAHYGTHENDPADAGYRAFLDRLAAPLVERLPAGASGLDYGSGPGPALPVMMEERGFPMAIYDPFFAPDERVLTESYDFVTCTEAAEHFFSPALEFRRLNDRLRPGGWLGVMTQLLEDDEAFAGWRYARDPTHVSFYRPETLRWIAEHFRWRLHSPGRGVFLFHKPGDHLETREPTRGESAPPLAKERPDPLPSAGPE